MFFSVQLVRIGKLVEGTAWPHFVSLKKYCFLRSIYVHAVVDMVAAESVILGLYVVCLT